MLACVLLVATACGEAAPDTTDTVEPDSTHSTTAPNGVTSSSSGEAATTVPSGWSVAALSSDPRVALGSDGALGSGCSPGTDRLPDGVWFGWLEDAGSSHVEFDLACLWPGRAEPAVSNDSSQIREVNVADGAVVYVDGSPEPYARWSPEETSVDNAPGLPESTPYWLFVNDGEVTEMAGYPEPVAWALSDEGWPDDLVPGCCATETSAPASPEAPLPLAGLPADGFYAASSPGLKYWTTHQPGSYDIEISKWVTCADRPELCLPDWAENDVSSDPNAPTAVVDVPLDAETMVVVSPIFSEAALVGNGAAFSELIDDIAVSLAPLGDPVEDWEEISESIQSSASDPDFPFGIAPSPDSTDDWPLGYRGPGGTYLTIAGNPWMTLEIRDGVPILYIHAGLVAG